MLGTDYYKLDKLNRLSRRICSGKMEMEQIRAELDSIQSTRSYPFWAECLGYATVAGAFSLFFGGDWRQCLVALFIGALLRFIDLLSQKTLKNIIFSKFVSAFSITALSFACVKMGLIGRTDEVIIGNIMLLIPGIGFTNALRDLFTGDSIAGILRSLEAVLSAIAIAAGYFLFVFLTGGHAV